MSDQLAKNRDPRLARVYVCVLPALVEIARGKGYALAVHGSMIRDLDLVAVPWVEEAAPAEELVAAICDELGTYDLPKQPSGWGNPGEKPHGRSVWTLIWGGPPHLDLSVLPLRPATGEGWTFTWAEIQAAFEAGATEARENHPASDELIRRSADAYCKSLLPAREMAS